MGTTISIIVLSVGLILVAFCNFITNYYHIKYQEKTTRRIIELESNLHTTISIIKEKENK